MAQDKNLTINIIGKAQIDKAVQKTRTALGSLEAGVRSNTASLKQMGQGTAATLAGVGALTKMANEQEARWGDLNTLVYNNAEGLNYYKEGVRELAKQGRADYADLSKEIYNVVSAGYSHTEGLRVLDTAQKLAQAGSGSLEASTDALTNTMNAWKVEATDDARVAGVLSVAIAQGKTNIDELAPAMGELGSQAESLGVSYEHTAASIALMTAKGIKAPQATTKMKAFFTDVQRGGDKLVGTFEEAGMSYDDFVGLLAKGETQEAILMIDEASEKTGTNLTQMFSSTEAADFVRTIGSNLDEFNTIVDGMGDNVEQTFEGMVEASHSQGGTFQQIMENKIAMAVEKVGGIFRQFGGEALAGIGAALPQVAAFGGVIGGVARTAQGMIGVLRNLNIVTKLHTVITKAATIATKAMGLAMKLLAMSNPLLLAITAITVGLVALWTQSEAFREFMKSMWYGLKKAAEHAWNGIKAAAKFVWDGITGYINLFKKAYSKIFNGIKSIASGTWNALKDGAVAAINFVIGKINTLIRAFNKVAGTFGGLIGKDLTISEMGLIAKQGDASKSGMNAWRNVPKMASGGIVKSPTLAMIGEAGPEAVVPLNRMRGGGTVININIQNMIGEEEYAEKMGDRIIDILRRQSRFVDA